MATVRLWDLSSVAPATAARVLRGHTDVIWSVAVSRDDRWLVTGSNDWTARVWDLSAEEPSSTARVLRGHDTAVHAVAIGPNDRRIITALGAPVEEILPSKAREQGMRCSEQMIGARAVLIAINEAASHTLVRLGDDDSFFSRYPT